MIILYILIAITLILLIALTKICLWQIALFVLGKNPYEKKLSLQALISSTIFFALLYIITKVLKIFNIDLISYIYALLMRFEFSSSKFAICLISYLLIIVASIFLQAIIFNIFDKHQICMENTQTIDTDRINEELHYIEENIKEQSQSDESSSKFLDKVLIGILEFSILLLFSVIFFCLGYLLGPAIASAILF